MAKIRSQWVLPSSAGLFAVTMAICYRMALPGGNEEDDIESFLQQRQQLEISEPAAETNEATALSLAASSKVSACCGKRGLQAFDNALPAPMFSAVKHEVVSIEPRLTKLDSAAGWWWGVDQKPRFMIETAVQKLHKLAVRSCAGRGLEIKGKST
jgi:hypothetical protein